MEERAPRDGSSFHLDVLDCNLLLLLPPPPPPWQYDGSDLPVTVRLDHSCQAPRLDEQ
jgi:hypothetical protein